MSTQTPTLMYLPEGMFIFNDEVQGDFLTLKSVGIIHTSMSSTAEQVNEIWQDVESWWESSEVIAARRESSLIGMHALVAAPYAT